MILTDIETHITACALRVAAEQYRSDAELMRASAATIRLTAQFDKQARDADALADRMFEHIGG